MDKAEVFIASSHKDMMFADKIATHLKPLENQGLISIATDFKFLPGSDWQSQIKKQINQADIILLLISPDFLASSSFKNIEVELQQALIRQQAGDIQTIPVIIRPVSWRGTLLDKLQALPTGGKPITSWSNRDAAFFDIAQGVRKAVVELTTPQTEPRKRDIAVRINIVEERVHLSEAERLHLTNLEDGLRRSYAFIRDFENMVRLSNDPIEKRNAQKSIEKRLFLTRKTFNEYMELANRLSVTVPEDIIQASARLEEISEDIGNTENVD
jgi:TIR domain